MNNNYNNENNGVNNNSQMGYNTNNLNQSNNNFNGSQNQTNDYVNIGQISSQPTTSQVDNAFNQQFNLNSNNQVNDTNVNSQMVSNTVVQSNNINNNQSVNNNMNSQVQPNNMTSDKFCGKCGNKLASTDVFCGVCGERVNNGQPQYTNSPLVNNSSSNINNNYNTGAVNDEELRRAYIGNKYSKFKNGGLSWLSFFIGPIYLIYRKMYLFGFLWFVTNITISFFLPFLCILQIGLQIFMLIKFKDLYLKHVDNKINKIKMENSNVSRSQLVDICARKGGTSVGFLVLTFVIVLLILGIIIFGITKNNDDEINNDNNGINENISNSDNGLLILEDCFGKNKIVANVKNGNIVLSGEIENKKYNKTLDIGNVDKIEVVSTDSCDQFTLVYIDTNNYLYRIDMTYDGQINYDEIKKISEEKVKDFGKKDFLVIEVIMETGEKRNYYLNDCIYECGMNDAWGANDYTEKYLLLSYIDEHIEKYKDSVFLDRCSISSCPEFSNVEELYLNHNKLALYQRMGDYVSFHSCNGKFSNYDTGRCMDGIEFESALINLKYEYGIDDYKNYFNDLKVDYYDANTNEYMVASRLSDGGLYIINSISGNDNILVTMYGVFSCEENEKLGILFSTIQLKFEKLDNGKYKMISSKEFR